MANRTDVEPCPKRNVTAHRRPRGAPNIIPLPRAIARPEVAFFDVLDDRRSRTGGAITDDELSSLLWHSMRLRERRPGRFGLGKESRSAPSAGGLHPIRLIVLPIATGAAGIYDDHQHGLVPINPSALSLNKTSIQNILAVDVGTTIQMAAEADLVAACYENPDSLIWRDAGALVAIMCLVATALELAATPVGRHGDAIVRAVDLPEGFIGVGAVHVGSVRLTHANQQPIDQLEGYA